MNVLFDSVPPRLAKALRFPKDGHQVAIALTDLSDVQLRPAGDLSQWRIDICGLRIHRPDALPAFQATSADEVDDSYLAMGSMPSVVPYPFFDDGRIFVQVWLRRVSREGSSCSIQERWAPRGPVSWSLEGLREASMSEARQALTGLHLLKQLKGGRPLGTKKRFSAEFIAREYRRFFDTEGEWPTQELLAEWMGMSPSTFETNIAELKQDGFHWPPVTED